MNKLFFGFGSFCVVYMDDLLIFSDSPEQHLAHLEKVFQKFRESKLKVKLSKSDFFKEELEFLGHKIGIHDICPADEKISAIERIKPPMLSHWIIRLPKLFHSSLLRNDKTHDKTHVEKRTICMG